MPKEIAALTSSPTLTLVNGSRKRSDTLLAFIDQAVQTTIRKGAQRHVYVLTCYFDIDALVKVVSIIYNRLNSVSGKVVGVTVAIDIAEWIRCRTSNDDLVNKLAAAAKVHVSLVTVLVVQVPGRLVHAKAYAVIEPRSQEKGFVVITSGNATQPGLGLSEASNLEVAALTTERRSLTEFTNIMQEIRDYKISEQLAMKQDKFLRALALFSSGCFYHRWQGSLGTEIRFTLTLTNRGKNAPGQNVSQFREYEPDGETISRSPIDIEKAFNKNPKPFSAAFWRNYAVDTLLGYWVPHPVAEVVDQKLAEDVKPYLKDVRRLTTPKCVMSVASELKNEITNFRHRGWIKEKLPIVDGWQERVSRFRDNTDLIKLRIHPYERVPEVFTAETRQAIIKASTTLQEHLGYRRRLSSTKSVIANFFAGRLTIAQLDQEWSRIGKTAADTV